MPLTLNGFLASLTVTDYGLIRPYLLLVGMAKEESLAVAGEPLSRAYFPHQGVFSLVLRLREGETVEVAMIGNESVLGAGAALGSEISLSDAVVLQPGEASSIDLARLRWAVNQSETLRTVLVHHEQLIFLQAQQSAACNARHSAEARMCRWLLQLFDLSGQKEVTLTQQFVAEMIGVRRNKVSLVAHALQQVGLITCARGRIQVANPEGLRDCACECYNIVKSHYDRVLGETRGAAREENERWH